MSALRQPTPPSDAPSVAALATTSSEVLDAIRRAYTFVDASDEAASLGLLAQRPDIAAVLLEALPHVRDVFGESTRILLLAVDDPSDASISLSARIVTSEPVSAARAKRDAFYRAFWLGVPATIDEVLSFGLSWPRTA